MRVDLDDFERRVRDFLASPKAAKVWGELTNTVLFNVIVLFCMIPVALLLCCTIVLTKFGFELLCELVGSLLTLKVFQNPRRELERHPERIQPLLLATIVIGPEWHGMLLGSSCRKTQSDLEFLRRKANEFAEIYANGSEAKDGKLFTLIRDDLYVGDRRRMVPTSHSEGCELYIFDIKLERKEIYMANDLSGWVAAIGVRFEESQSVTNEKPTPFRNVEQIPWNVVEDSVDECRGRSSRS